MSAGIEPLSAWTLGFWVSDPPVIQAPQISEHISTGAKDAMTTMRQEVMEHVGTMMVGGLTLVAWKVDRGPSHSCKCPTRQCGAHRAEGGTFQQQWWSPGPRIPDPVLMVEAKEIWLAGPRASFQTGSIKDLSAKAPVPSQPCPEATMDPGASSGAGKEAVWTSGNVSSSTSSQSFWDHRGTTGNFPQPRRPQAQFQGPRLPPCNGSGAWGPEHRPRFPFQIWRPSKSFTGHCPRPLPPLPEGARSLRPCPMRILLASLLVGSYERWSRAQMSSYLRGKPPLN